MSDTHEHLSKDEHLPAETKLKWPVRELIRLALVHAEEDRRAYGEADPGPFGVEAIQLADALHKLRMRRYGETFGEHVERTSDVVDAYTGNLIKRGERP